MVEMECRKDFMRKMLLIYPIYLKISKNLSKVWDRNNNISPLYKKNKKKKKISIIIMGIIGI